MKVRVVQPFVWTMAKGTAVECKAGEIIDIPVAMVDSLGAAGYVEPVEDDVQKAPAKDGGQKK